MIRHSLILVAVAAVAAAAGTLSRLSAAAPPPMVANSVPAKPTRPAAPDTGMTLKADRDGTVFRSLTVEGEDRIRIEFERPPIELDLDPEKAPGLEWGSARDVLDRSVPDFGAPFVAQSARESSPFVGRPWLVEFTSGPVARFQPQVEGVERWKLTVANARGEALKTFQGHGDPPKEIVWDGRSDLGEPATPGLRYSYVFEAFDRAGNKRNFVGEGFQLMAYRITTPSGPVLVCAGSALLPPQTPATMGSVAATVPAPAVSEVATWLNQSAEPTRPIRVAITARSADAGNAIAAMIMRQLPPLVLGDPARIQCAITVQPDAPESGAVKFFGEQSLSIASFGAVVPWPLVPMPPRNAPPGNALAKLRVDAQLSSSAAAESLEIEEDELSEIECGMAQASTRVLANMARIYHTDPHRVVKAYLADRLKR